MRYRKLEEVCRELSIAAETVEMLAREGLIQIKHTLEDEAIVSGADAERLRVSVLLSDLDVNVPGIEIILQMREEILETQKQFHEILDLIAEELRKRFP
jgi:MerR family transcriptional regulator/heat shock protein HspR